MKVLSDCRLFEEDPEFNYEEWICAECGASAKDLVPGPETECPVCGCKWFTFFKKV